MYQEFVNYVLNYIQTNKKVFIIFATVILVALVFKYMYPKFAENFNNNPKYLKNLDKLNDKISEFKNTRKEFKTLRKYMCTQQKYYDNNSNFMKNDEAREIWKKFMKSNPNFSSKCSKFENNNNDDE